MKTVSVIIPSYAYGHFLRECVLSVIGQTYPIHEIIIVSDGAIDSTVNVANSLIEEFPKNKIILVEKENGGLSSARNAGIKVATGDFCAPLDSDDKLVPGAIAEQVRLMEDDYTIAQVALMHFGKSHEVYTPQGATYERLLNGNTIFCNSMFSRRAWTESRCGYDETPVMRLGLEDFLWYLDLTKQGCKVRTSDFIGLRYRQHDNNMTNKTTHPNWAKIMDYMRTIHPNLIQYP